MKKTILIIGAVMAVSLAARAATATDVVSADRRIPSVTNTADTVLLSRTATAMPLTLNVFDAVPTNATVHLYSVRYDGAGKARTNTVAGIPLLSGGVLSTNLSSLFGYLFKEPIYVKFDVATNGAYQIIGELYNPPAR